MIILIFYYHPFNIMDSLLVQSIEKLIETAQKQSDEINNLKNRLSTLETDIKIYKASVDVIKFNDPKEDLYNYYMSAKDLLPY